MIKTLHMINEAVEDTPKSENMDSIWSEIDNYFFNFLAM